MTKQWFVNIFFHLKNIKFTYFFISLYAVQLHVVHAYIIVNKCEYSKSLSS